MNSNAYLLLQMSQEIPALRAQQAAQARQGRQLRAAARQARMERGGLIRPLQAWSRRLRAAL
ncbi:MAG TPA: hypothetical protein VM536_23600 [Chloroflexia bacterium]|nr:hypothetical protein [Chloroflexia bacterium]